MTDLDASGCAVSGATPAALAAYREALAMTLAWRSGAQLPLARAISQAPAFVMPHILQAYTLLCSRDVERVRSARAVVQRIQGLPANDREAAHLRAIGGILEDDYEGAKKTLTEILSRHPQDLLALHAVHAFDYLTGDVDQLGGRITAILAAWPETMPVHHAVLSMHAFGLVESGDYEAAERDARAALAANPGDARAHHAMAHVFEMSGRPAEGIRWLQQHQACWSEGSSVATHCWWHLALFQIEAGRLLDALATYDQRVRLDRSGAVADLIDASALLWRLQLRGIGVGDRWTELAQAWAAHVDDAFCSFSDLHAMLAFVGARDEDHSRHLEARLAASASSKTRHGRTSRLLGLPACKALVAFGSGDYPRAIRLLASLPAAAHRLGGSHAQRDVMSLTLLKAIECIRRPLPRPVKRERAGLWVGQAVSRLVARMPGVGVDTAARPAPGE